MPRSLFLLLLASLLAGCSLAGTARAPAPTAETPAATPPRLLAAEPVDGEIGPGERHRYRLDLPAGRWAVIEVEQREVDLDLTLLDPTGATIATAVAPGNWSRDDVDLITGDDGSFVVEVAAAAGTARRGGYLLRLVEERPLRPDDPARQRARRRLREIERPPENAPALAPGVKEESLRGLLESAEVSWSDEEAARISELLGHALLAQQRPEEAAAVFRRGLDRLAAAGPRPVAAWLGIGLGTALLDLKRPEEARHEYRSAVEAARASGDHRVFAAAAFHEAVFLFEVVGEPEAACQRMDEVLAGPADPPDRVSAHLNLGLFRRLLGDLDGALAHYEEAARVSRQAAVGDAAARFHLLRTGGTLYRAAGSVEDARAAFGEALQLAIDEKQTAWETSVRVHLGALLIQLGEYREARQHLERSAHLAQEAGNADSHARSLLFLAWVELGEGDASAAAELLDRALTTEGLSQDLDTSIRFALGVAKAQLGEGAEALEILEPVAARAEASGLHVTAARAHHAIGSVHLAQGELDQAALSLGRAAELAEAIGDPLRQAAVSSHLAELEVERGRLAPALEHVLEALRLQEAVRSQLIESELRSSFLARWRGDFDRAIEISMRLAAEDPAAGHDRSAFALSEAAHARTLSELLTEARVDVRRGISPRLLAAEREADRRLSLVQTRLTELLLKAAPAAQVETLRHEWEEAGRRREEVEREVRRSHPRYAEIRYPQPPGVERVQGWLPERTALLEYALGERSSALFVVTRDDFAAFPLPASGEIAAGVALVRRLLVSPSVLSRPQLDAALADLTRLLVDPAADRLAAVDRLLIVPDRDLFYLPFEALGDPAAPQLGPGGLLRRWTVTYLPSAAVLPHLERETTPAWRRDLLVFADPPPLAAPPSGALRGADLPALAPAEGLPSLPGARREAQRIAALFPADRVDLFVGEAARESLLKSPQATVSARRLHIASHGVISVTDPEASYVLLAPDPPEDGRLHLHEVFNLELDAELVVLSGCETGLGPRLEGEGLIGLVRGFLYAGARDLVVSLWPVSDAGTEEMMVDFYRRIVAGRPTAEALRAAKLARFDAGETHPSLWAPFVVFGAPAPARP
jgi:CHAT domain-containing protein/Tfp pilus assembly protein PilF